MENENSANALRLRCLELALESVDHKSNSQLILTLAERYHQWITETWSDSSGQSGTGDPTYAARMPYGTGML